MGGTRQTFPSVIRSGKTVTVEENVHETVYEVLVVNGLLVLLSGALVVVQP